jgi:hypothetical protein
LLSSKFEFEAQTAKAVSPEQYSIDEWVLSAKGDVRGRKSREDGPAVAEAKDVALSAFEVGGRTFKGSSTCVVSCQSALQKETRRSAEDEQERKGRKGKEKETHRHLLLPVKLGRPLRSIEASHIRWLHVGSILPSLSLSVLAVAAVVDRSARGAWGGTGDGGRETARVMDVGRDGGTLLRTLAEGHDGAGGKMVIRVW